MAYGTIYLIPISLGDASTDRYQPPFNIEMIRSLKTFVVENARTARHYIKRVLPSADISKLTIYEIDKHNDYSYPDAVFDCLTSGEDIGLMSEAGCPAVADPGHLIVARAHTEGIRVVPLVGPSSILLSLMASGFNGQAFAFHGYLPIDSKERRQALSDMERRIREVGETQIFIETPYRNDKLIQELIKVLGGNIRLCVAVDLTTDQEEVHTHTLKEWKLLLNEGLSYHKRPAIFLINRS